jgi:hypothetical protein
MLDATSVQGNVLEHTNMDFGSLACAIPASPFGTGPAIMLEPDKKRTLTPGSYGSVNVKSGASLTFSSGDYFVDSLVVEPQAVVRFDTSGGAIRLYTRSSSIYRGAFVDTAGRRDRILVVHTGVSTVSIEAPFVGTLVAPNAAIELKSVSAPGHVGSFFGKRVELFPFTNGEPRRLLRSVD